MHLHTTFVVVVVVKVDIFATNLIFGLKMVDMHVFVAVVVVVVVVVDIFVVVVIVLKAANVTFLKAQFLHLLLDFLGEDS